MAHSDCEAGDSQEKPKRKPRVQVTHEAKRKIKCSTEDYALAREKCKTDPALKGGRSLEAIWSLDVDMPLKIVLQAMITQTDYAGKAAAEQGFEPFREWRYYSKDQLAKRCGCSEKTVRRAWRKLLKLRFLEKETRSVFRPDYYRMTDLVIELFDVWSQSPHDAPSPVVTESTRCGQRVQGEWTESPDRVVAESTKLLHEAPAEEAPSFNPLPAVGDIGYFPPAAEGGGENLSHKDLPEKAKPRKPKKAELDEAGRIGNYIFERDELDWPKEAKINIKAVCALFEYMCEQHGIEAVKAYREDRRMNGKIGNMAYRPNVVSSWFDQYTAERLKKDGGASNG